MATIKSHTDLEQCKRLKEILNEDAADLWWDTNEFEPRPEKHYHQYLGKMIDSIPCWSLAALQDIIKINYKLEKTLLDQSDYFTYSLYDSDDPTFRTLEYDNPVDACVEMILKLHERKLL